MQTRILGIVLVVVGAGVAVWVLSGIATGRSVSGALLGFVLFSLPFLAVGLYFLLRSKGEIKQATRADKQRNILDAVTTRGRVSVPDLAIENDATRDEVRDYVYDLIGKGLFAGYVNWDKGELVSAEAAQIKEGQCPNCGGAVELAGKGLVRCPYCGTETYLSGPVLPGGPVTAPAVAAGGGTPSPPAGTAIATPGSPPQPDPPPPGRPPGAPGGQ